MIDQLLLFDIEYDNEEEDIIDTDNKICRTCNLEKHISDFYLDRGAVYSRCKDCCKKEAKILAEIKKTAPPKPKNGKCECCGRITKKWYCDHCHDTLKFRGWVCFDCNQGIGFLGDKSIGVFRALVYLLKNKWINQKQHKKNTRT